TVISSDANDGDVAGKQFTGESAGALRGVFDTVESTLGLSIPDLIQGRAVGTAQGEALGAALRDPVAAGSRPKRGAAAEGSAATESASSPATSRSNTAGSGGSSAGGREAPPQA